VSVRGEFRWPSLGRSDDRPWGILLAAYGEFRVATASIGKRIEAPGYRVRHDKVDASGSVTLRHKGKLHYIGIGCPYAGWRVILLVDASTSAFSVSMVHRYGT
jgi:hypothetical protein